MKTTLVLVPGLLCDARVWRHQRAAFAESCELQVPELAGFDSIPAMASAVLAQVAGDFALAGHSLGGRIALEVMRQAPQRVQRLALLDTGVHPRTGAEPAKRQALVQVAECEGMRALARAWLPPMLHPARLDDRALVDELEEMIEARSLKGYRNQVRALLARPDATPVLATVRCPTLVLCGREDAWSPPAQHEPIAAAIAGARLAIVERCGHMATVEQPEAVSAELRRWLAA